jgi:hypothetical protein
MDFPDFDAGKIAPPLAPAIDLAQQRMRPHVA